MGRWWLINLGRPKGDGGGVDRQSDQSKGHAGIADFHRRRLHINGAGDRQQGREDESVERVSRREEKPGAPPSWPSSRAAKYLAARGVILGWLRAEVRASRQRGAAESSAGHATEIFQSSISSSSSARSLTVALMLVSNHESGRTLLGREVLAPSIAKSKTSFTGVTQVTFVPAQLLGLLKPWSAALRSGW
jgi:hypothetical protein